MAHDNLGSFNPQDFFNTVWAFATMSFDHPLLFHKIGDVIASRDGLQQHLLP